LGVGILQISGLYEKEAKTKKWRKYSEHKTQTAEETAVTVSTDKLGILTINY
jgi:hypothetical protein